jgi:hypothetical protein
VAAVFTVLAVSFFYQDGFEMCMLCLECPQTDYVRGCGAISLTRTGVSHTSRAARLYGAPDSVNHLSGQFNFGRDGKMFANVGTVVAVDSLEQVNSLTKDVNSILHDKLEKGEEIRAVRVGSGSAISCSASNLISAQMRIQRFRMIPEVLDLARQHGHQEPPFMAALIYLEEVRGGDTGSGLGSGIELIFFLGGL